MCINGTNFTCQVEVLQGLVYTPVFLLGFLVNAAALRAFIAKWGTWTDTHIYMFNLAIADFTLVLFLPFRVYDAFFCLEKTIQCTFLIHIHYINMYASIFTTTAITVQRYLSVRFPLHSRHWRRKKQAAVFVCFIIWVFLLVVTVLFSEQNKPEHLWTCFERCKNEPMSGLFVQLMVAAFVVPLGIIAFCSSQIIRTISKMEDKSNEIKRIAAIIKANAIIFFVCYTPIHISFVVNYFYKVPSNWMSVTLHTHRSLLVSEWIASTNCIFDAISYYFLLKRFYEAK